MARANQYVTPSETVAPSEAGEKESQKSVCLFVQKGGYRGQDFRFFLNSVPAMGIAGLDDTNTAGKRYNRLSRYFWRSIMGKKRRKMGGRVEKVIKPLAPSEPEKAQISVEEADTLYREIRVENAVTDENGGKARLKPGAEVDVIIEADSDATIKKP